MRIDMKRTAETNQRKGLTGRTVLASAWLILCVISAYFFTGWLVSSQTLSGELVYGNFSIPSTVSLNVVRLVSALLLVGVLQFIAIVFLAATNPAAKVRSGRPTATAQSVDYYEQQYSRHA
jgi:phosphoglycerol transferase MdoB-like AlkP superfamily enzyme